MRKIYLEPAWKLHSLHRGLIDYPPPGYQFITSEPIEGKIFKTAGRINLSYLLHRKIYKMIPLNLARAYWGKFRKPPQDADLTYSCGHLVFRKEPWVVDLEYVTLLVGSSVKHFKKYKEVVQKSLASEYCRKILCETEAAKRTVLFNLDCTEFEHKLAILPHSAPKKNFTKNSSQGKVKLLFVASANIPGQFEIKGGREALEAFILLKQKYDNIELVIRSDVPRDIKRKYLGLSNLRIIEGIIPWQQIEDEFKSADIFLLPAYNTPFSGFLDAMSYELPVVTIDAWANSEIVEDGKTGLLAKRSEKTPYCVENSVPNFVSPQFQQAIRTPDPEVVSELVEKVSILIDHPELRRRMGKEGRREVEEGRFSIETRNRQLKQVLDEATAGGKA